MQTAQHVTSNNVASVCTEFQKCFFNSITKQMKVCCQRPWKIKVSGSFVAKLAWPVGKEGLRQDILLLNH